MVSCSNRIVQELRMFKIFCMFGGKERGVTLIETLVALAILGIVAVGFLGALATGAKAMFTADERTTAESLARGQMEYIKNQGYSDNPWAYTVTSSQRSSSQQPSWWDADNPPLLSSNYAGYSIEASAEDFDVDGDGTVEVPGDDEGIRRIMANIYHPDTDPDPVITLEAYKVNR